MANTNAPFGFRQAGATSSVTPNFSLKKRRIAYNDSTACYYGDPVKWVANTPTGYITQVATPSDLQDGTHHQTLAGIFYGCEYISTAQKRKVWSPYWPGSDTAYDVIAYVCDDPHAEFIVQGDTTSTYNITNRNSWGTTAVGLYATFAIGSGSTATGLSGAYLTGGAATAMYPFIILDIVTDITAPDPTASYHWLRVGFNNEYLNNMQANVGLS